MVKDTRIFEGFAAALASRHSRMWRCGAGLLTVGISGENLAKLSISSPQTFHIIIVPECINRIQVSQCTFV